MALNFLNDAYFAGLVGIGTDSPLAKLHITKDNTTGNALLITNSGSSRSLEINHNADGTGVSDEVVRIMNDSTRLFTIESDGKVGIGTAAPLDLLAVHNSASGAVDAQMNFTTAATGQASADGFRVGWNGAVAQMYLFENADMRFATNNAERIRITSAGGISFGSTGTAYGTSGQILKSNGNASPTWIDGSAIPGVPAGSGTLNTVAMWTPDGDTLGDAPITISGNNSTFAGGITATFGNFSSAVNALYFRTAAANTDYNLLTRNNTGNALFVQSAQSNANQPIANFRYGSASVNQGTPVLQVSKDNSHFVNCDVGIGETSPTYKLHVVSASTPVAIFTGANNAYVDFSDPSSSVRLQNSGHSYFGTQTNTNLNFKTNGSQKMTILAGGNVGIGTTSPGYKLSVDDDTVTTVPKTLLQFDAGSIADNGGYNIDFRVSSNNTADRFVSRIRGIRESTGALSQLSFWTESGSALEQRMTIRASGKVGIGTTTPGEKLHVNGNVLITSALLSNQENTDVDTGTETVASVAIATYTAAFFDFVIKKTTNVRSGTVYACHDGTTVQFTETSTQDLGDTSDVTLSVDISGGNMRLLATVTSDDWSVKSLIRAI